MSDDVVLTLIWTLAIMVSVVVTLVLIEPGVMLRAAKKEEQSNE